MRATSVVIATTTGGILMERRGGVVVSHSCCTVSYENDVDEGEKFSRIMKGPRIPFIKSLSSLVRH